jgi:hypothetical protein
MKKEKKYIINDIIVQSMQSTKYFWIMVAMTATTTILSCSVPKHIKQKPEDLSYAEVRIETLLRNRPHAQVIMITNIPDGDKDGDSMVYEYQGSQLISKRRYYGNNPDDLSFSERYYRDPDGHIDSITITEVDKSRSILRNISNLFYDATDTNVMKVNVEVSTFHFRYDPRRKCYYSDEKAFNPK